jgi:hypothetical protein
MIGLVKHIQLPNRWSFEMQLFAFVRSWKDGITPFELRINWDRFVSEHSPAFQIELTILNCYNHIWLYQNNHE